MNSAHVHMQFDDPAQQREAARLGMWVFLATEVLLFGTALTGYLLYRHMNAEGFSEGSARLYFWIGVANTAVLLTSSVTMAMAVESDPDAGRRRGGLLAATIALGLVFLSLKGVEYTLDVREHLLPGPLFVPSEFAHPRGAELFLLFYWILTAIHATHMLCGIGVITPLAARVWRSRDPSRLANVIEGAGLYWHFVDIVWLFLLPLLYMVPR